ncbi:MAG TPA: SDR family NAD(P)-dependent oxidoreductase, partial [Chitinophagaceae bacterium]
MAFEIDLSGKTVIITGVSSGIGAGIAKMYARAKACIAGCALEPVAHESVQQFIQTVRNESGKTPLYLQADVTDLMQLENFVYQTVRYFGTIDILASNAGANVFKGAENCRREEWLYNMNLNLESHWNIARLCKPYLAKDGNGVIVINSSCHAFSTIPGSFPYNVAKAGLKALVQSLTVEWGPAIRTVGVAPGFMDTRITEAYFNTFPNPAAERKKIIDQFPLKRLG